MSSIGNKIKSSLENFWDNAIQGAKDIISFDRSDQIYGEGYLQLKGRDFATKLNGIASVALLGLTATAIISTALQGAGAFGFGNYFMIGAAGIASAILIKETFLQAYARDKEKEMLEKEQRHSIPEGPRTTCSWGELFNIFGRESWKTAWRVSNRNVQPAVELDNINPPQQK
jgi:hypothetical protein